MKPRHALVAGFGLGAIAVLALGGIAGGQTVVELAGKVRLLKPSPTAPPPAASRLLTPASAPRLTSPSPIPPPNSPGPRAGAIMVYDPENRGLILFGGSTTIPQPDGTNLAVSLGDTWLWDGVTWKNLNVDGPSPRSAAMAAYDSVRQEIVAVRRLWAGWTRAPAVLRRHVDVGWPGLASAQSRSQARPAYARG